MTWLVSALITPLLNFVWNKVILGVVELVKWAAERAKRRTIVNDNDKQADVIEGIAQQIRDLVRAGKPVPPELEKRMLDESAKGLIGKPFGN